MTAPRLTSRLSKVDTIRISLRARVAISPAFDGLPKINHREIHAAFDTGQDLQVTAKILGMVVDQCHQFFHQLAQRPMLRELGDDDQKAGTATSQNFERPDSIIAHLVAGGDLPQTAAFFGV